MTEHSRGAHRALFTLSTGLTLLAIGACGVTKEPPKVPLAGATTAAQSDSTNPHADRLPPAARTAIDLGNAQYRAGKFADALKSYREAAKAAPDNAAPYFGIYMAAQKQGNSALADSAMKVIRASSGETLSDSTLRDVHVRAGTATPPKS